MSDPSQRSHPPGIVIIGTPRSGTTLLRRILDAHPNISCPPETYLLSAAARFLHEDRFAQGLRIGVLSGLSYAGFPEAEVLGRLRGFVFGFLDEHARRQGKTRWAEKTAFDAFHLDAIRRVCGDEVRYVCIQRHGLDVACSLRDLVEKTGGYVQELHAYLQRHPEPLRALAHAWVDTAQQVETLVREEGSRAIDLRYEDLVREPERVMRRVLDFVEEPYSEGLIERALSSTGRVGFGDWKTYARATIDDSSVDRWKALREPEIEGLAGVCNPTLQRLGYPPVAYADEAAASAPEGPTPEDSSSNDEEARRRYELGLLVNRMKAAKAAETE